jgi:hypothetical protein
LVAPKVKKQQHHGNGAHAGENESASRVPVHSRKLSTQRVLDKDGN